MTYEYVNVGTAPNDGLGDPLRTAYIKINNNFAQLQQVGTEINATAVTTGTYYPVFVAAAGSAQIPSVRTASTSFSINAATNVLRVTATTSEAGDLAEVYAADADYPPGTVVSFGGDKEVTLTQLSSDARVAGVISQNPGHLMNHRLTADHRAIVALTGRVPTNVIGTVTKGDMMVSAGNGSAQASATPALGTVIGKALENFDGETGIIEIVVGRM